MFYTLDFLQESGGISKGWKRRWCVLADFALFIYKSKHFIIHLHRDLEEQDY